MIVSVDLTPTLPDLLGEILMEIEKGSLHSFSWSLSLLAFVETLGSGNDEVGDTK